MSRTSISALCLTAAAAIVAASAGADIPARTPAGRGEFRVDLSAYAKKPRYTIKEVMRKAHKAGLMKRVARGNATDSEKRKLLELYEALADNTPPEGGTASWTAKTRALVDAATAAVNDEADAGNLLQKAANCTACHQEHRP